MKRLSVFYILLSLSHWGVAQTGKSNADLKTKTPERLLFHGKAFTDIHDPCKKHMCRDTWEPVNDIRIVFNSTELVLKGINKQGKSKWKINTQKLDCPCVDMVRQWRVIGKFDTFLRTNDGGVYLLRSKTGRIKKADEKYLSTGSEGS